jgi:1,4-dihydroxy-2-naphthoate octaprenyltransferase
MTARDDSAGAGGTDGAQQGRAGRGRDFRAGLWRLADPKISLTSAVGIYLGTAMAAQAGPIAWGWLAVVSLAFFAMEVAKNAWGDVVDWDSGNDTLVAEEDKTDFSGGKRVLVDKLLSRRQAVAIAAATTALGLALGTAIVFFREPEAFWLGLVGLALGWSYHGPPLKFAYRGLGEADVVLIYGPAVVLATYATLTQNIWSWPVFWLALPQGLIIAAFLWVNQFPDYHADRKAGKMNLVARLGKPAAAKAFPFWYLAALALTVALPWLGLPPAAVAGAIFAVPAFFSVRIVLADPAGFHRSKPAQPLALLAFLAYSLGSGTGILLS